MCGHVGAEYDAGKLRAPRPHKPGEAEYFTPVQRKIYSAQYSCMDILNPEDFFAMCQFDTRILVLQLAAHHPSDEAFFICIGDGACVHNPPVPQYRNAVPDVKNFLQPMRDVNDADTFRRQPSDQRIKIDKLPFCKGRGRFIKGEYRHLLRDRFRNFNNLLLGYAQRAHRNGGVEYFPELF